MGTESTSAGADKQLLSELFLSHHQEVLAYCARRIGRSEAEDAASEVFAIASRRVTEIDWDTTRPWLYGIARGVLANQWRSLRRSQRLLKRIAGMAPTEIADGSEVVVRGDEFEGAMGALRTLRRADREVLMLAAWEDLKPLEIARALGISRAAADQRLSRAKKRYARSLAPLGPGSATEKKGVADAR